MAITPNNMHHPRRPLAVAHITCALFAVVMMALTGCGSNTFKEFEEEEPAEDAAVALEQGNPTRAINILTKALEEDSDNQIYLSLLGMAYAQRAGVDPLTFVERMGSDSSGSSGNGVTALFDVMPEATSDRISDVDLAVATLYRIPSADLQAWDKLKLAMFQTAAMTLRAKLRACSALTWELEGPATLVPR